MCFHVPDEYRAVRPCFVLVLRLSATTSASIRRSQQRVLLATHGRCFKGEAVFSLSLSFSLAAPLARRPYWAPQERQPAHEASGERLSAMCEKTAAQAETRGKISRGALSSCQEWAGCASRRATGGPSPARRRACAAAFPAVTSAFAALLGVVDLPSRRRCRMASSQDGTHTDMAGEPRQVGYISWLFSVSAHLWDEWTLQKTPPVTCVNYELLCVGFMLRRGGGWQARYLLHEVAAPRRATPVVCLQDRAHSSSMTRAASEWADHTWCGERLVARAWHRPSATDCRVASLRGHRRGALPLSWGGDVPSGSGCTSMQTYIGVGSRHQ